MRWLSEAGLSNCRTKLQCLGARTTLQDRISIGEKERKNRERTVRHARAAPGTSMMHVHACVGTSVMHVRAVSGHRR